MPDEINVPSAQAQARLTARKRLREIASAGDVALPIARIIQQAFQVAGQLRDEGVAEEARECVSILTDCPIEHIVSPEQIREIALQAAGAASGVFLRKHPDEVMPTQEVIEEVEMILKSFGFLDLAEAKTAEAGPLESPNSSSEN